MKKNICVVGLGYVGLPLAVEFAKYFNVLGFDESINRINELKKNKDINNQIAKNILINSKVKFTSSERELKKFNIFLVTVPTPVNTDRSPNLTKLKKATLTIAKYLKKNDLIIYESTVYPGLTEEILIPIISHKTRFKLNKDFFVGYSPERISPGDKKNISEIKKVVSGSNKTISKFIFNLYKKIIKAGVYLAPNIKTAEACKILENIQRDVNISLMNEASIIFNKLNIDTFEVLKAANTKWNFLNFTPGLVGGHCISVDPYYMKYKAEKIGLKTQVISSGRNINENMVKNICSRILSAKNYKKNKSFRSIGIMGLTFKENCSDCRNSQVFKIIDFFLNRKFNVEVLDPKANYSELNKKYRNLIVKNFSNKKDCLILAVPHKEFLSLKESDYHKKLKNNCIIFDVKKKLVFKQKKNYQILSL
tara:strand:- start:1972 stop:3237 length:1266 start_codon:yes stop_codon:yes gene_type:complete